VLFTARCCAFTDDCSIDAFPVIGGGS